MHNGFIRMLFILLLWATMLKMGWTLSDSRMVVYATVDNAFKLYADGGLIIDRGRCWSIFDASVSRSLGVFAIDGYDDGAGGWSMILWTDSGLYTDPSWKCIDYELRAKYGVDGDNWVKKDFNDDAWPFAGVLGPASWASCNVKNEFMKYAPPDISYIWAASKLTSNQGGSKSRVLCRKNYYDKCYNLKPCRHGGSCSNTKNMADYYCECSAGFVGKDCDVNFDECSSNPCHHGGSCTDNINSYTCACKRGYKGSSCETDIDECASKPCMNSATCTDGINNVMCSCKTGYGGRYCDKEINECESKPCQNGASCSDMFNNYECTCKTGFEGNLCDKEVNECNSSPCEHGSTCDDLVGRYVCKCHKYWTGINCESCLSEYTAEQCDFSLGACKSSPCHNLGTCSNTKDGFTCLCDLDYTGSNCETEITECRQNPCRNSASCEDSMQDGVLLFKCYCPPEFTGRFCEQVACAAGFTGVNCAEQCTKGTFGQDCAEECHCYGEAACDHVTGECPGGCQEGFKGSACSALSEAASAVETGNDKMNMTAIIGGAVGGVALLALIVGAVVLRKRKKQQADDKLHLADRNRNEESSSESSSESDSSRESSSWSEV